MWLGMESWAPPEQLFDSIHLRSHTVCWKLRTAVWRSTLLQFELLHISDTLYRICFMYTCSLFPCRVMFGSTHPQKSKIHSSLLLNTLNTAQNVCSHIYLTQWRSLSSFVKTSHTSLFVTTAMRTWQKHYKHGLSHPLPGGRGCLYGRKSPKAVDSVEPKTPNSYREYSMAQRVGGSGEKWTQDKILHLPIHTR